MADLHKVGSKTPQAVVYKSESHKLHQAFTVKSGSTIVQGQPVKLNDDGTISPYTGTANEVYLGIAVGYSKYPCYPPMASAETPEITVMVEGFAIIHGVAKEAMATTGFATTDGTLDESGVYPNFKLQAGGTETKFISLNTAEAEELVRILVK